MSLILSPTPKKLGYTLIEVLVAIGLILIVLGFSIISFFRLRDRQNLVKAKEELAVVFNLAQSSAQSGKLGGCGTSRTLKAYRVFHNSGSNQIFLDVSCNPSVSGTQEAVLDLDDFGVSDVVVTANYENGSSSLVELDFYFRVLTGDVDDVLYRYYDADGNPEEASGSPASDWTITLSNSSANYQFVLTRSGEVSQGEFISS
ncbi:MAG: prepilin-type N-terminal cleavage/methylation domain-containing protein [Candidatus Pacebacteria bacterium]|nr:prepilin-type N-terminal cleavage/methylation domain-containing protein [Candidatus Paceibacterota bacterium]